MTRPASIWATVRPYLNPGLAWAMLYWGIWAFALPAFLLMLALVAFAFADMLPPSP